MRGRSGHGDPDFGSDSFLDIIANLVGILVILIVLAGLRAAQVSIEPDEDAVTVVPAAALLDTGDVDSGTTGPTAEHTVQDAERRSQTGSTELAGMESESDAAAPGLSLESAAPTGATRSETVSRQVAEAQIQELLSTVRGLDARLTTLPVDRATEELKEVRSELAAVAGRLPRLQQQLAEEDLNRRRSLLVATEFDAEYKALRKQLVEVNQTFEELRTAERPVEDFELRINPVGRRSRGEEIMFRIENDRVVLLPAAELFGKAERQSGALTPLTRASDIESGSVGPFNGVVLDYESRVVAGMAPGSSGSATYVLQKLMRGTLRVTRHVPTEDWNTAIQEQGMVSRRMLAAPRNAFARLFVTPDSFEAARRVATFIRTLGHGVATMPIEPGTDIKLSYGNGSDALVQ